MITARRLMVMGIVAAALSWTGALRSLKSDRLIWRVIMGIGQSMGVIGLALLSVYLCI